MVAADDGVDRRIAGGGEAKGYSIVAESSGDDVHAQCFTSRIQIGYVETINWQWLKSSNWKINQLFCMKVS